MITTKTREYRSFDYEVSKEEDKQSIRGVALNFEVPRVMFVDNGQEYYEVIQRGALNSTDLSDVVLNIEHTGKPAAKTRNGTLKLEVNSENLSVEADLSKNATGRELYEDIQNGFYDRMSFAFIAEEESYNRETRTRTITKIKALYDVSAVTRAAYEETSLSVRSFFEAEAEKERIEIREREVLLLSAKFGLKVPGGE